MSKSLRTRVEDIFLDEFHARAHAKSPGFILSELTDGRVVATYGALLIQTAYIGADLREPEDMVIDYLDSWSRELVRVGLEVEQHDGFIIIRDPGALVGAPS